MRNPLLLILLVLGLSAASAAAVEPFSLAFSGGVSNFNKPEKRVEAGFEVRLPTQLWGLAVATFRAVSSAVWGRA